MTETVDSCDDARKRFTSPSPMPGAGQRLEKMQGHWVLARAGKRVLRPGGLALTRRLIDALSISIDDRVVEFAPGMGVTARMVLRKKPLRYWGVERDPAAAARLESLLPKEPLKIDELLSRLVDVLPFPLNLSWFRGYAPCHFVRRRL